MEFKMVGDCLVHSGRKGQRWGIRNGPPYPLKPGQFRTVDDKTPKKISKRIGSSENKKRVDKTLSTNVRLQTFSQDRDRLKKNGYFYAAYTKKDKANYGSLSTFVDDDDVKAGKVYRIRSKFVKDVKVASEQSAVKAFKELYSMDPDFYNYIRNKDRMMASLRLKVLERSGYRDAVESWNKLQNNEKDVTSKDVSNLYRLFNFAIPNDRDRGDVARQREKFFSKLKEMGYSAVLDTNDALYNGLKTESPIIVFDIESVVEDKISKVKNYETNIDALKYLGYLMTPFVNWSDDMENGLTHSGIKGMKWYQRRFQNPDGSLTPLGRIRYGVGDAIKKGVPRARILIKNKKTKYETLKENSKEELSKKEQKANKEELARHEKEANEKELKALAEQEKEAAKQKAIRSGDAREILKYQDQMTLAELNEATNRMKTVTQINQQAEADAKKIKELTDYNKKSHKIARGIVKAADVLMKAAETGQKFADAKKKFSKWLGDDESDDVLKGPLNEALAKVDKISVNDLQKVKVALQAYNTIKNGGIDPNEKKDPDKKPETTTTDKPETTTSTETQTTQTDSGKGKKGKKGKGSQTDKQVADSQDRKDPKDSDTYVSNMVSFDADVKRDSGLNALNYVKGLGGDPLPNWSKDEYDSYKQIVKDATDSIKYKTDKKGVTLDSAIEIGEEILKTYMSLQHSAIKRTIKVYVKR